MQLLYRTNFLNFLFMFYIPMQEENVNTEIFKGLRSEKFC
jgi:hypothetical protein